MLREQKIETIQVKEDDKHKRKKPYQVHISESEQMTRNGVIQKECKRDT